MIADTLLIFLPLRALRLLTHDASLRQRLSMIFTASALTTVASIVNAVVNFKKRDFGLLVAADVEVCRLIILFDTSYFVSCTARDNVLH
jgi:hypothetical protein